METHIDTSDPPGVVNNPPSASPYLLLPNKEPPANNHHGCIIQAPQVGVNGTGTGLSAPPPSASYLRRCSDVISVMQDDLGESRFGGPNGSGTNEYSSLAEMELLSISLKETFHCKIFAAISFEIMCFFIKRNQWKKE